MAFKAKKIVAKVAGGDPGSFNPMNSEYVMSSFKLKGKKFKSVPKGFLAIQPEANMIYAGFDYNRDGVINVTNESFTNFQIQINPFDAKSATEKLADKFSSAKAKGKLLFKPDKNLLEDKRYFDVYLDNSKMDPYYQFSGGRIINDSFTYDALLDVLLDA